MIEINRVFENHRLGMTFLAFRSFSLGNLERSLDAIRLEKTVPLVGVKKRVIQRFDYVKEKEECHISSVIDLPIKVKELIIEEGELKTKERVEYFARNIEAIIRLKMPSIITFSQSQREVRKFNKYIKEITLKGFNPVPIKFNPEGVRKRVKDFEIVHHLKISESGNQSVKSIRFDGQNLLGDDLVSEILSNGNFEIVEIGGIRPLSSDSNVKFYMNNRGRVCIYGDQNTITTKNIYNLIQDIEKMIPREHNLRQRGSD